MVIELVSRTLFIGIYIVTAFKTTVNIYKSYFSPFFAFKLYKSKFNYPFHIQYSQNIFKHFKVHLNKKLRKDIFSIILLFPVFDQVE